MENIQFKSLIGETYNNTGSFSDKYITCLNELIIFNKMMTEDLLLSLIDKELDVYVLYTTVIQPQTSGRIVRNNGRLELQVNYFSVSQEFSGVLVMYEDAHILTSFETYNRYRRMPGEMRMCLDYKHGNL